MTPLSAAAALDNYFLECRSKLLDVAAMLDRLNRGRESAAVRDDPRLQRIRQALEALLAPNGGRAERVQQIFSLEYHPGWERPQPH